MSNTNLTCLVDKKEYSYCPTCDRDKEKPSWYSLFCCENCHDIFTIVRDNSLGKINDNEAREKLNDTDLSNKDQFDKSIQACLERLLKNDKVVKAVDQNDNENNSSVEVKKFRKKR